MQDKIDWNEVAVLVHRSKLGEVGNMIEARDAQKMQAAIKKVKHMFTYDYTCAYISSFVAKVASATAIHMLTRAGCQAGTCGGLCDAQSPHIAAQPAGADTTSTRFTQRLLYMPSIMWVLHKHPQKVSASFALLVRNALNINTGISTVLCSTDFLCCLYFLLQPKQWESLDST